MSEIIGPDGQKYFTQDHFDTGSKEKSPQNGFEIPKIDVKSGDIIDYVYLIGGALAVLIGLYMLADLAVGLILLFIGSTGVNYWMMKHNKRK